MTRYQIVLTRPDGSTGVFPATSNRINIGSAPASHIQLEGAEPNHARVLFAGAEGALLIDLSKGGGPIKWQPDTPIQIAGHILVLQITADELPDTAAPPTNGTNSTNGSHPTDKEILQRANELLETMSERRAAQRSAEIPAVTEADIDTQRGEKFVPMADDTTHRVDMAQMMAADEDGDTGAAAPVDDEALPAAHPGLPEDADLMDSEAPTVPPARKPLFIPPIPPVPFDDDDSGALTSALPMPRRPQPLPVLPQQEEERETMRYIPAEADEAYTRAKEWVYESNLSAHLPVNPVNAAAGERVRVPLSVRNGNQFSSEVRIVVTGLPADWTVQAEPRLRLLPQEVRPLDIIIETRAAASPIEAMVHISDVLTPSIALRLPLTVILKREIDLSGRLESANPPARQGTALLLHNHTREQVEVFISGSDTTEAVRLNLPQTIFQIPAGQEVRVPVRFEVGHRPLLFAAQHPFTVAAQQGSRAPLAFSGQVQVPPYLNLLLFLLLALLAGLTFFVLRMGGVL